MRISDWSSDVCSSDLMLPCYVRALALAEEEKDQDLKQALLEVFELTGRFILPDTYLAFLLPRIRGDPEIVPYGIDASNRTQALEVLAQCMLGSRPSTLSPHMQENVGTADGKRKHLNSSHY